MELITSKYLVEILSPGPNYVGPRLIILILPGILLKNEHLQNDFMPLKTKYFSFYKHNTYKQTYLGSGLGLKQRKQYKIYIELDQLADTCLKYH